MSHPRATGAMALKDKNLAFFEKHHQPLYQTALTESFNHLTLNIDGDSGKVDLWDDRVSLYEGDAHAFAEKEVEKYRQHFSPGSSIATIIPPVPGELGFHRFFSKRMHELTQKIPSESDLSANYTIPDFYPLMVFFGCGVGIHIDKMVKETQILNVVIFEPDPEYFFASLYITDWESIFQEVQKKGQKIDLLIASGGIATTEVSAPALWNLLINYGPSYPLCSLFYNHINSATYQPLVDRIREDMHFFLNQWGYYDDEINQLNNALHNIGAGISPLEFSDIDTSLPTIIVGAGPSFDMRVNEITRYRDKVLLISCGTSVHSLLACGLVPDIHVEIESHMLTHEHLSNIINPDFFKNTLLIAALQVPPNVFSLFERRTYFLKDSTALATMFTTQENIVHRATPTCTNTGIAIATHFGIQDIFLYGMDFGFPERTQHHSKTSIYFSDKMSDAIQSAIKRNFESLVETESVHGEKMYTIPMYNTSRMSAEQSMKIRSLQANRRNITCSEGVKICDTEYWTPDDIHSYFAEKPDKNISEFIDTLIGTPFNQKELRARINFLDKSLKEMATSLLTCLKHFEHTDPESIFKTCHNLNMHLMTGIFPKYGNLAFFLRGSVWHYLNIAAAHTLSINDANKRTEFINEWKSNFEGFLKDLPEHFHSITSKNYPDNSDPWIREDIVSNEHLYAE